MTRPRRDPRSIFDTFMDQIGKRETRAEYRGNGNFVSRNLPRFMRPRPSVRLSALADANLRGNDWRGETISQQISEFFSPLILWCFLRGSNGFSSFTLSSYRAYSFRNIVLRSIILYIFLKIREIISRASKLCQGNNNDYFVTVIRKQRLRTYTIYKKIIRLFLNRSIFFSQHISRNG